MSVRQFHPGHRVNRDRIEIIRHELIQIFWMLAMVELIGAYGKVNNQTFEWKFGLVASHYKIPLRSLGQRRKR